MRKVVLYIAMSLDGYIADGQGKVDWLRGQTGGSENPDAYSAFVESVDTVVMGWNTYHQIATELSPEEWVYSALTSYVVTHRTLPSTDGVRFVGEDPCALVRRLRREPGRGIWICGGGTIIQPLIRAGLIDEYDISVIPTILGSGIRLFEAIPKEIKLNLTRTQVDDGIVELVYGPR
ncbi:MAG: dihydrofolate reductase [Oscillibacter sp.]|nr:dihydrofolate reductase [Oscillibacter sp.]